jgi:hypothetical protein
MRPAAHRRRVNGVMQVEQVDGIVAKEGHDRAIAYGVLLCFLPLVGGVGVGGVPPGTAAPHARGRKGEGRRSASRIVWDRP